MKDPPLDLPLGDVVGGGGGVAGAMCNAGPWVTFKPWVPAEGEFERLASGVLTLFMKMGLGLRLLSEEEKWLLYSGDIEISLGELG